MNKCIEFANKTIFKTRFWHISLMMGKINEIADETREGWAQFFKINLDFFTRQEEFGKETTPSILADAKGKTILGSAEQILNKLEDSPKIDESVQSKLIGSINVQTKPGQENVDNV